MKSGPLVASRTAAVATQRMSATFIAWHRWAKRPTALRPRSIASGSIAPVLASDAPRPAITFSLNSTKGMRRGPS
jgi:hypothetical protein